MSLKERINEDLRSGMKARDERLCSVLRMLKAQILEAEVQLRAKRGRDYQLDDSEVTEVVSRYAKQRSQSIEAYKAGGRSDLVEQEQAELEILQQYLPRPLTEEEIEAMVVEAIGESGASSMKDLGSVMKIVMPRLKGAADGNKVRQIVQQHLVH